MRRSALLAVDPSGRVEPDVGHRWDARMVIESAFLSGPPGLVAQLEVGGQTIGPALRGGLPVGMVAPVGLLLDAGVFLRARVIAGVGPAVLTVNLVSAERRVAAPAKGFLRWSDGDLSIDLYDYDPATRTWTVRDAALCAGRATLAVTSGQAVVTLGGSDVLRIEGGALRVRSLAVGGPGAVGWPRIELWTAGHNVATLGCVKLSVHAYRSEAVPVVLHGEIGLPASPGGVAAVFGFGRLRASTLKQDL